METTSPGGGALQLLLLLVLLIPAIFFVITQQKTLKAVQPENRRMHPGLVWLQIIPLFNYVWAFIVVRRIADSLAQQYAALQSDNILGVADEDALKLVGKRPTYGIGLAYCVLLLCLPLLTIAGTIFSDPKSENPGYYATFGFALMALGLAVLICWIVYWVQLAGYKNKLKQMGH